MMVMVLVRVFFRILIRRLETEFVDKALKRICKLVARSLSSLLDIPIRYIRVGLF